MDLHSCLNSGSLVYRNFVVEVHRKTESVLNNQIKQPTAQVQSLGYDNSALLRELQDGFGAVRRDVSFAVQKMNTMQQGSCPNVSCLTTTVFIAFAVIQILILVGYFMYRLVSGSARLRGDAGLHPSRKRGQVSRGFQLCWEETR